MLISISINATRHVLCINTQFGAQLLVRLVTLLFRVNGRYITIDEKHRNILQIEEHVYE